jgi:hypothetical protein
LGGLFLNKIIMDYFKNVDYLGCISSHKTAVGIQYFTVTDLANEPVDVDFFKLHARIDFDTDDNLVEVYLKAARQELEQWSQLSFGVKTIGLTALELPNNYRLMFGKVNAVTTTGYTNVGDILKEGGTDIDIEFTTIGTINDAIRVAICRQAASFYINRENVKDTKFSADVLANEAKMMIKPFMNITLC